MSNPESLEGNANLLVVDEEMNKICLRYSRQLKNREGNSRSQVRLTYKKEESVTDTNPAPTRFDRKTKRKGGYQMETLCAQITQIDVHDQPVKFDAPYSLLLQLIKPDSEPSYAHAETYIPTEDLNIRTFPTTSH